MSIIFLVILYITFVGLGMQSTMLGVVWPVARIDLGKSLDSAGLINSLLTGGTVIGGLASAKLGEKFGKGKLTAFCMFLMGAIFVGYSFAPSFLWLVALTIPLGMVTGALDMTVNNYVAINYQPRYISWLHAFWSFGGLTAPILANYYLAQNNWRGSYRTVGIIQIAISILLVVAIPMWQKMSMYNQNYIKMPDEQPTEAKINVFATKGALSAMLTMFFYGSVESSLRLWSSSYVADRLGVGADVAARCLSVMFGGVLISRLLIGFLTVKFSFKQIIGVGQTLVLICIGLMFLPLPLELVYVVFALLGLGNGATAPGTLHQAPERFGREKAQQIMSYQTAFSFAGSMIVPVVVGFLYTNIGINMLPISLFIGTIGMIIFTISANRFKA